MDAHSFGARVVRAPRTVVSRVFGRTDQERSDWQNSHSAFAALQLDGGIELVEDVKRDPDAAEIDPKLRALLHIAAKVAVDGKSVTNSDIEAARAEGATDLELHDTVLIAAAFCMYNRYVDGLDTWQPADPQMYQERAHLLVEHGYGAAVPASAYTPS